MNIRTFFKLYSLPFLIIVVGLGVYAGVVMFMEQKNFIISKRGTPNTGDSNRDSNTQIALNTKPSESTPPAESVAQSTPPDSQTSAPQETEQGITPPSVPQEPAQEPTTPEPAPSTQASSQAPSKEAQDSKQDEYLYAKYRANIRKSANQSAPIIARAAIGEQLLVRAREGEWVKVRNRFGLEGYMAAYLLTQPAQQAGEPYTIIPQALNVRQAPDGESQAIGRLIQNTRIYVLAQEGEWGKIALPNGRYGYISLQHIKKAP